MAMVKVKVDGLALDMTTNSPVVILAAEGIDKVLPIWIGHTEAWAIAMELSGVGAKRPMTHDLLKAVIGSLSAEVAKIEITELKEQTFYARVLLKNNGEMLSIDARPSDSIALALKTKAPIFAEEELFNLQGGGGDPTGGSKSDSESLADRLKKINPEDFGKYSL
jgi:bifunctional DNase/RNase